MALSLHRRARSATQEAVIAHVGLPRIHSLHLSGFHLSAGPVHRVPLSRRQHLVVLVFVLLHFGHGIIIHFLEFHLILRVDLLLYDVKVVDW